MEKGWKGLSSAYYDKMGCSSSTAGPIFDGVRLGKPVGGRRGLQDLPCPRWTATHRHRRAGWASPKARLSTLSYSKERVQFGKPIATQQSIAFKLADMCWLRPVLIYSRHGLKGSTRLRHGVRRECTRTSRWRSPTDALQIHGGSGFLKGMEVERCGQDYHHLRGTNEISGWSRLSSLGRLGRLGE